MQLEKKRKGFVDTGINASRMQVEVSVKCMQTNFGGHGLSGFRDFAPFKIWLNFPFGPWTTSNNKNLLKRKSVGLRLP